jgi:hypothetical protein
MQDLLYTQGQDNMAGIYDTLEIVEQDAIDTASLPTLVSASDFSISGNIVLLAGRRFGRMYFTVDSGSNDGASIGSYDAKSLEFMLKGRYPKLDKAFWVWFRTIQNGPLIVIYKQSSTGRRYVLGLINYDRTNTALQIGRGVYLETAETKTGAAPGDESGGTITFKWNAPHGPIEYNGTVDITP